MFAFIGLDIRSDAIRLLQLVKRRKRLLVKNYAVAHLPEAAIVEGKIQQAPVVQSVLAGLVEDTKTRGCAVALALPANAVISQQISMPPGLSLLEYEMTINAHLGRYFPGVSEALCFDFFPVKNAVASKQEFFLVAARQWQVESYAALVESAGLRVKVMDVDHFALLRAVPFAVKEFAIHHVVALVRFGVRYAELIIFSQQTILLQQRWHEEDESSLAEVVKQALELYATMQPLRGLDYVVFAGELLQEVGGLREYFSGELGLKILTADPLAGMSVSAKVDEDKLRNDAGSLLVSCGLAMRRFVK